MIKMWGTQKFSDINAQKITIHLAIKLYAVLLLLCDLRCGFLNLEALYNFASSLVRTHIRECHAAPNDLLNDATCHKES